MCSSSSGSFSPLFLSGSEQQVLELRHIDVALVLRVLNQFVLVHEASHNRVGLRLLIDLIQATATNIVVVHCVDFRNEHLSSGRLLPCEFLMWLVVTFTVLAELLSLLADEGLFAKHWLLI